MARLARVTKKLSTVNKYLIEPSVRTHQESRKIDYGIPRLEMTTISVTQAEAGVDRRYRFGFLETSLAYKYGVVKEERTYGKT